MLIAYYFPPYPGVGTFRIVGFHRYLREHGWSTHVVTATPGRCTFDDDGTVTRICETKKSWMAGFLPLRDSSLEWAQANKETIYTIIEKEKPTAVLITGGPFLYFELAYKIKKRFNVPYILDYRDPFTRPIYAIRPIRDTIAGCLERRWASNALAVLIPIEQMRPTLSVPHQVPVHVIENGFNDDLLNDMRDLPSIYRKTTDRVSFVYAGKFTRAYGDPTNLLRVLGSYSMYGIPKSEFVYVGDGMLSVDKAKYPLVEMGYREHIDSLRIIRDCDIGVIISAGGSFEVTTKVYDYIALNKPILCIGAPQDGGTHEVLRRYGNFQMCNNDPDEIAQSIKALLQKKEVYRRELTPNELVKFGRRYQVGELARLLHKLI